MPYRMLIEIDLPNDEQPSLVYSVEIDNADPRALQLLELRATRNKKKMTKTARKCGLSTMSITPMNDPNRRLS